MIKKYWGLVNSRTEPLNCSLMEDRSKNPKQSSVDQVIYLNSTEYIFTLKMQNF